MFRLTLSLVALLASGCVGSLSGPVTEGPGLILNAQGEVLTEESLVAELGDAGVVILGEIHDNPIHHARQARLVAALQPAGLAFEMIPELSEEGVQVFLAEGGDRALIGPAIGWERMGWPDWKFYAPVFEAAPGAYIAGGGVPRAQVRKALFTGAATAYGPGASEIGLTRPLDPETRVEVEDEMIASHCNALPREVATGMVEAQRLRDARFARAALRAREIGGGQVVLITGNGHARTDRGVPGYLIALAPDLDIRSVGMIEAESLDSSIVADGPLPFDYIWLSRPVPRTDPCDGFG